MIPDVVGQSTTRFDQRFLLTALVPTAVFAPAISAVLLLGTGHLGSTANWYMGLPTVLQVLAGLAVTAAIWFLATIVASQWANIVRFYEGYPLLRLFAVLEHRRVTIGANRRWQGRPTGIAAHLKRRDKLRRRAASEAESRAVPGSNYDPEPLADVYEQYPPAAHRVLPTSLGNILRAAEDYGYHRYGFDSIHLWPRLAAVLPNDYLVDVERTVIEYQTPLVVSFGSGLLAVASLPLMRSTIPTALFVVIFSGSAGLSWIAYRLSFQAAKDYGDHLRTAVDLYRTDLLKRWWPELLAIDSDRLRLEALRDFVMTGTKDSIHSIANRKKRRLRPISVIRRHEQEAVGDPPGKEAPVPMFGVRLSLLAAVAIVALTLVGSRSLDRYEWVLVANRDIDAFDDMTGAGDRKAIRRGSIDRNALSTSKTAKGVDRAAVANRIALRAVPKGAVILTRDVGPTEVAPTSSGLMVELVRDASQVRALDLQPGDKVFLDGAAGGGDFSHCAIPASSAGSASADSRAASLYVTGEVLAVSGASNDESRAVVLRIDLKEAPPGCLGNLDKLRVLRAPA